MRETNSSRTAEGATVPAIWIEHAAGSLADAKRQRLLQKEVFIHRGALPAAACTEPNRKFTTDWQVLDSTSLPRW